MAQSVFKISSFIFAFVAFGSFAQDTLDFDAIDVNGVRSGFKKVGLYDGNFQEEYNVRGYTQLSVFENSLADFWTSEGEMCVKGKLVEDESANNLHLKWNKDQDGCDWVGIGLGWDGWTSKDMGYVIDTLALELTVRSLDKPFTNLPWAFCFEDYSESQAWLGYNRSFLKADAITTEWTKIQLPLQLFPFEENDVDASNIKQLLIQLFSEGEIEIQSIELVAFSGKLKQEATATQSKSPMKIDGSLAEWSNDFIEFAEGQKFAVNYTADSLFFAFNIVDETPQQNTRKGGDLWQGDAIEIAFSTNPSADPKRSFLLLSDQHIGINCGANPYVWDWKKDSEITSAKHKITVTKTGYILELAVPVSAFYQFKPKSGDELDLEIAIDLGTAAGREKQLHWNSGLDEGFHLSPAKWGVLILQ
jgi:hypothetical protein